MEGTVASNDDKQKRSRDQAKKRTGEDSVEQMTGTSASAAGQSREQAAASSEVAQTASSELASAFRDYQRTVHRAWLRMAEDCSKANLELAAAHHRIAQEATAQRAVAYFNWLNAVHEAGADTTPNALKEAYEAYAKAGDEIAKTEREKWDEAHQNCQRSLTTASDAYAQAIEPAVNAYLSRFKDVWTGVDFGAADPQTLTLLAVASAHAARLTQATPRARPQA
jgi:hypothetical protein